MKLISNSINLSEIFRAIENDLYVVLKKSEIFPKYYIGSDIDILCYDIRLLCNKVLSASNKYAHGQFTINVTTYPERGKVHIDFLGPEGGIELRFDIFTSLEGFKKVSINPSYALSILDNRQKYSVVDHDPFTISLPSEVDDTIIRYLEYVEYFELRPDKVKHYDYILAKLENNPDLIKFIDKLHMYTTFAGLEVPQDTHFGDTTNRLAIVPEQPEEILQQQQSPVEQTYVEPKQNAPNGGTSLLHRVLRSLGAYNSNDNS